MISEALKFLTDLGAKAGGFHAIQLPDGRRLVGRPDGTFNEYAARIPDKADTLETLDSFLAWIDGRPAVEVYVGAETVEAIVARSSYATADAATLILSPSAAWLSLCDWINHGRPQSAVVKSLRGPLRGCSSDGLLGVFRSIEFRSEAGSTRKITGPASDTLGRSAHREALSGGQELPDTIAFSVPVFDLVDCPRFEIPVAVDVDYDAERIRLLPAGDCIAQTLIAARRWLASEIKEGSPALVFVGSFAQK
jgi:hypothetical protein